MILFNPHKQFIGSFLPNCLLRYPDLTPVDKLVWARLAQFAGDDGKCFPKQRIIAEELGVNKNTVSRSLNRLEDKEFIKVIRPEGREIWAHKGNQYLFIKHEIFCDPILRSRSIQKVDSTNIQKVDSFKKEENHKEENHKTIPKNLIDFVLVFHNIQKNNHPKILKKDLTKNQCYNQALILSNLIRIDKYNFEKDIKPAILWAVYDSFWSRNILSLATLRNKSKNNDLTKFQNILSKYLDNNKSSSSNKIKLSPERLDSYKKFHEGED